MTPPVKTILISLIFGQCFLDICSIKLLFSFSQNFYSQCFGDETLVMIKDSTPVNRKQLNPNKVEL